MKERAEWLGIGLYPAAAASRLLTLPAAKVRRMRTRCSGGPQLPKLDDHWASGSSI
jgi:hypothetical protein